ncbi:hypothetical protein IWW52_003024, partial [Coemansia sp. RSA 2704]
MAAVDADLDLNRLRRRQVEVLTRALGQFVTLKSTAEGWQPVQPLPLHSESVSGGDISVHLGRKSITVNGKTSDIYRMTASIPLDADVSRDTQGQFSAYLSELRDWQAVLESPGIRNLWNYFVGASTTLEMLDAHTRITRSQMRSPVPGQAAEFAHSRDLLMVETSLVDPTTVVYVATSFPTTDDDPAYMRQQPNIKRVESDLWAWCVELGTPADAISLSTQQQNQRTAELNAVRKPRACVQVTCFMHLELKSWKSNNALACRAATNLIPALVAYLRLHGAPPRLARIGPVISLERTEWRRTPDAETAWEAVYSVATRNQRMADSAAINQPILSRILDLETSSTSPPTQPPPLSHHTRRVSSLTTYLSSSFERQQGEASALGTHAGGILRDGEEEAVVATRARLSGSILELVIDASKWHSDKRSADISIAVRGFRSARQLFQSIKEMHSAAPELFTSTQLELTWDSFKLTQDQAAAGSDARRNSLALPSSARRAQEADRKMVANLTAAQLVRCFAIRSQKSSRRRYLVRVLNPPIMASAADYAASDGESSTADSTFVADNSDESTADRVYGVSIAVCRGAEPDNEAGVRVNGLKIEVSPFSLDPASFKARPGSVSSSSSNRVLKKQQQRSRSLSLRQTTPKPTSKPALPVSTPVNCTPAPEHRDNPLHRVVSRRASAAPSASSRVTDPGEQSNSSSDIRAREPNGQGTGLEPEPVEPQDLPLARLRQASQVPSAKWVSMGTAASGAIAVSRAELWPPIQEAPEQGVCRTNEPLMTGMLLRAEALVEGWTIFDVAALATGLELTAAVSGLWAEAHEIEQISANASIVRCASAGTWAVAARDAVVCRTWRTNARSSRIDVAECSIDPPNPQELPVVAASNPIRADLALSAWVLEKSHLADTQTDDRQPARLRSSSVATMTGSPAVDAEVESQRRKQHVVKITHYLQYHPRGWLALNEDGAGMRRFGAALGIDTQKNEALLDTLFPPIPPPGSKDALVSSITKLVRRLDEHGAPPAVVWSRNANVLSVEFAPDHVQFRYRMAAWGAPRRPTPASSSTASSHHAGRQLRGEPLQAMSAIPASFEDSEYVEAEFRIEHRVWAFGSWTAGSAHVELTIEPFYATSAVACFVDPEADPHATRVRVRHHRAQLLPRVEEDGEAMEMAWPTVHLAVARREGKHKAKPAEEPEAKPAASSLAGPRVAPWSVPPRVVVNGVTARVRYLRRDENGRGFYARCLSVAAREASRLARAPPPTNELFMERLPDPEPAQEPMVAEPDRTSRDTQPAAASQIAIQNYSVQATLGGNCRVARPNQFADIMKSTFARIRHEIELLDAQSPRSRLMQQQQQQQDSSDARSSISLMTAIAEDDGWEQRQSGDVAVFERLLPELSAEVPVTVAQSVLQGASVQQVSQLLTQHWERQRWDRVLFGERRVLEYVPDAPHAAGGVSVEHSAVHVPLLFDRRDALTVAAVEQAAYLPVRQQLRNARGPPACGTSSTLGDYFEPTVTLVEASVPGSQPLSSVVRAQVPLYAVRVDPIDGFERARGRAYAYPSCRVTIASSVDLLGTVPLALRRALAARIPESHLEQLRQRLQEPLWPRLEAPAAHRRLVPDGGGGSAGWAAGEASEEDIDG